MHSSGHIGKKKGRAGWGVELKTSTGGEGQFRVWGLGSLVLGEWQFRV